MRHGQVVASAALGLFTASLLFLLRPSFLFLESPTFNWAPIPLLPKQEAVKPSLEEIESVPRIFQAVTRLNPQQLQQGKWLVLVYAPWCPHSQRHWPEWERQVTLAKSYFEAGQDISVAAISLDEQPEIAAMMGISALPTLFVVEEGKLNGKPLPLLSPLAALQLRIFAFWGRALVGRQSESLRWLNEHRRSFYSTAASVLSLLAACIHFNK